MRSPTQVSFASDLCDGLSRPGQKTLPSQYLYDEVGSALFDAITALPEYGLTRADLRLLQRHSAEIAALAPAQSLIELGSGSGVKTRLLLSVFAPDVTFYPIDVSKAALERCAKELFDFVVEPIRAEFLPGLAEAVSRRGVGPVLVAFLGSNIGNFDRSDIVPFLRSIRDQLWPGDFFLLGADLLKPVPQLIAAYDDEAGVTAAFNRNLLVRLNRDFGANFCPRCFEHKAVWNSSQCRIEMHLKAVTEQRVQVKSLDFEMIIPAGETIHTESSHKFEVDEVRELATAAGFTPIAAWTDEEWPFAEMLFQRV